MADTTSTTDASAAADPGAQGRTTTRKQREGVVVSSKADKTIVVEVLDQVRHRRYGKIVRRTTRVPAHDEANEAQEGDRVRIHETRPLSRTKHWRLSEILERAK